MIDDGSWPGSNAGILQQCGRIGFWTAGNDGATVQSPGSPFGPFLMDDPPNGVTGYIRTVATLSIGNGWPNWGALVNFGLNMPSTTPLPYDASRYTGISFWMKSGGTNQIPTMAFAIITEQAYNMPDHPYHQTTLSAPAPGEWTKVSIPWSDLTQPPSSVPVAFDPTAIMYAQWLFAGSAGAQQLDLSIGDVEFIGP